MFDHYNQIEEYKKQIIALTNASGLTIGMAYYVLKDVLNELYLVYLEQKDNIKPYEDKEYVEEINTDLQPEKIRELSKQELMEELENETN